MFTSRSPGTVKVRSGPTWIASPSRLSHSLARTNSWADAECVRLPATNTICGAGNPCRVVRSCTSSSSFNRMRAWSQPSTVGRPQSRSAMCNQHGSIA
jgi:hypothetical protein